MEEEARRTRVVCTKTLTGAAVGVVAHTRGGAGIVAGVNNWRRMG